MTTLADELESAAFVLDEAIGTAAYGHKGSAIVGSVLAARLRARAARVREMDETTAGYIPAARELFVRIAGPDLGPTRRGEPA
jgi:hypothetical protein